MFADNSVLQQQLKHMMPQYIQQVRILHFLSRFQSLIEAEQGGPQMRWMEQEQGWPEMRWIDQEEGGSEMKWMDQEQGGLEMRWMDQEFTYSNSRIRLQIAAYT